MNLTQIIVTIIGGVFSVIAAVFSIWLAGHMKDQAAAAAVNNAVKNSLGAIQQAAQAGVVSLDPKVTVPVTPEMGAGIQYVLNNAGNEASRLGITQAAIVEKISAQIGLQNIVTNQSVAANTSPTVPAPLDPVPASHTS